MHYRSFFFSAAKLYFLKLCDFMSDKYHISIITTQHASRSAKSQLGNLNYGLNEINGQQTRRNRQLSRKRETARESQQ